MNKIIISGNLTKEPILSETQNGIPFCKFNLAVNRPYQEDGNRVADYFNVVTYRSQAENCAKYLKKGSKVGIVGTLQNRSYEANDGTKRTITEIVAEQVEFLSPKQAQEQVVSVTRERPQLEEIVDGNLPF